MFLKLEPRDGKFKYANSAEFDKTSGDSTCYNYAVIRTFSHFRALEIEKNALCPRQRTNYR